jgi:hypothetical protein
MLTNQATGDRWGAVTTANGRFAMENVPVGGPYVLLARTVGYTPVQQGGIQLALGQRFVADLTMEPATVRLETVQVTVQANPLRDATRTGPSTTLSDSTVHSLATLNRDFQGLLETAPQVSFAQGNLSIAGQNNRFNNILIDGSVNNDLFGLADNGLPGGQIGSRAISLEAVQELQLQVAPFDVRLGGFTGGLLNVVTKSGTNAFHGSAFEYFYNQSLVGSDVFGQHPSAFATHQFGASVGGPIVKNVAHFFVAFEQRQTESPVTSLGPNDAINIPRLGYTAGEATAVQQALAKFGVKAGGFGAVSLGNPNPDVFAKVDVQLAPGNTMTLSENYVAGYADFLDRGSLSSGSDYDLASAGHRIKNYNSTTRFDWSSTFGKGFANDLIVAGTVIRDKRDPSSQFATIDVGDSTGNGRYVSGADEFSQHNRLYQDIVELTDDLTGSFGDHHITIGTHDEFYHFHNEFFPQSYGQWQFNSVQDLVNGKAFEYQLAIPLLPGGPTADFHANQIGFYLQDQWIPSNRLTISAGVRLDVPLIPDNPPRNDSLLAQTGINTSTMPSGNTEISPRFGFNYDLVGDRSTIVRGGSGLFEGRPAVVWLSNAFSNTGVASTLLTCFDSLVPAFNPILANAPQSCRGGPGSAPPVPTINVFDKHFAFPQIWRSALSFDRLLPGGFVFSLDGMYSVTEHELFIYDRNIQVQGTLAGEGGRPIYGSEPAFAGARSIRSTHLDPNFGPILQHVNRNGDYSYSFSPQLNKTFGAWALGRYAEIHASYTYAQSYDRMSLSSSIAASNYGFSEISGNSTIFNRPLTPSQWSTPHQIKVSATNVFPLAIKASLEYVGRSGTPYSYAIFGDVAGLGVSARTHDLVYVPTNENDVTLSDFSGAVYKNQQRDSAWSQLNSYINSVGCLRNARGHIIGRDACRNPWQDIINMRIGKQLTVGGQSVELSWDILNLPNLINRGWGQYKQYTPFEDADIFSSKGFDAANHRFVYNFAPAPKGVVTDPTLFEPSEWRMQVGVHYAF